MPNETGIISISGQGGDHLFLCPPLKEMLCDLLLEGNLSIFVQKLKELAFYYREPIYDFIIPNLKAFTCFLWKKGYQKEAQLPKAPWFKPRANVSLDKLMHPLFDKFIAAPPGKLVQIVAMYDAFASIHGESRGNQLLFYPFLCQPMIEQALSIPTYKLFENLYDRYLLRKGIDDAFHPSGIWRRNKGSISGHMQNAIKDQLPQILQLVLDGEFTRAGLVDQNLLEQKVKSVAHGDTDSYTLINLISLEFYLRLYRS
jgi:asparagine synthase (glutamine-hydrolysing)